MTELSDLPFASMSASDSNGALEQSFSLRMKGGGRKKGAASYPDVTATGRSAIRAGWGLEEGSAVVQVTYFRSGSHSLPVAESEVMWGEYYREIGELW